LIEDPAIEGLGCGHSRLMGLKADDSSDRQASEKPQAS
jgi:hypothetical protein